MKSFIIMLSIIILICVTVFCDAADTVKIAAIGAKTGDAATSGYPTFFYAVRFAVDEINQQGGLLGTPIELLEFDYQSFARLYLC